MKDLALSAAKGEPRRENRHKAITSSQHTINSLSKVGKDKAKFSEIIDQMFVPTVEPYRQREKEKPFRRPTLNPTRQSQTPSQRAAARQRMEAK